MAKRNAKWGAVARDSWHFWGDVAAVVWLRSGRIARGGAAGRKEFALMFAEKLPTHCGYVRALASGKGGRSAVGAADLALRHYGPGVSANRKRLAGDQKDR